MATISMAVKRQTTSTPDALWAALTSGSTLGWPMLRECRSIELGSPLLFNLPSEDGQVIEASGRIVAIQEGVSLTIAQESPWQGRVKIALRSTGTGCDVAVTATMDDECVPWFLDSADVSSGRGVDELEAFTTGLRLTGGLPVGKVREKIVNIGLLVPLSGAAGIMGRSTANAALLAVEELNESQAFGKRRVELVVEDDRTSPAHAEAAFARLISRHGCHVVIANVSSASMDQIRPIALAHDILVLNTSLSERSRGGKHFFQLGESPADQLMDTIPRLMTAHDTRNWFILGNDYVWPRTVGMVASEVIAENNGRVAGECYRSLGTRNFDDVIGSITSSGADVILSALVGIDAVVFERRFFEGGHRSDFKTLAANVDDSVLDHIGHEGAMGIWSVQDYFMPTLADEMDDVAARYQQRFGLLAPRLTSMGKAAFDAVHVYAQAAQVARSIAPDEVSRVLRSGKVGSAKVRRRLRGDMAPAVAAEVTAQGFKTLGHG